MELKENAVPNARTPEAHRKVLTPKTAVLSPLSFTPATRPLQEVPKRASVSKEPDLRAQNAALARLVDQLFLAIDDVQRDAKSTVAVLQDKVERAASLEKELDASQSAHEELSQLLQKSMEREREKGRRLDKQQAETEEWKEKYQKLYQDAKSKIALSAEKIQHYRAQIKDNEEKAKTFIDQVNAHEEEMQQMRDQSQGREKERNERALEQARSAVADELSKAHEEAERAKRAVKKGLLERQRLESEILELQQVKQDAKPKTKPPRLSSGSSTSGTDSRTGRFSLAGFMSP